MCSIDKLTETAACDHSSAFENDDAVPGIRFFPPLFIQRYTLALKYLQEFSIKNVIDFGCAECGFLKLLPTVPSLEQIALVDINRNLLISKQRVIKPEMRHFIFKRDKPLHVSLWVGSAVDADLKLQGYEAVTLIEVIEHLYPDVLKKVTINVFGTMRPKLCIVTTPNIEFNVLFENSDPKQFRHWDHKFEWTRQEFSQWCEEVCETYGYTVTYTGVGKAPSKPESFHLGHCSQAAVFVLDNGKTSEQRFQGGEWTQSYELIAESDFPYDKDVLTQEQKMDIEILNCLHLFRWSHRDSEDSEEPLLVPVSRIANLHRIRKLGNEESVRESLQRMSQVLSPDGLSVVVDVDSSDSSDDNDERSDDCDEDCSKPFSESEPSVQMPEQESGFVEEECWDLG